MSKHRMKSKLHSAKNPAAFQHVRESFARQGLMKHLGAELTALSSGECEIRVRHHAALTQQHGYFHGGVTASIADSATGYAAYTMMPADSSVLAVEYKINFVAPAEGSLLIARGRVLRSGRTLKICAADVFVVNGKREILCATSLSTIMALPGQSDTSRSRPRPAK
jgi:uncharacterized protein (TIGR00369 family)